MTKMYFTYLDPPYEIGATSMVSAKDNMHKGFDHDTFAVDCDRFVGPQLISYNSSQLIRDRLRGGQLENLHTPTPCGRWGVIIQIKRLARNSSFSIMKCEVTLYVAGRSSRKRSMPVTIRKHEQVALARNPNAKVIGVTAKLKHFLMWRIWAKALGRKHGRMTEKQILLLAYAPLFLFLTWLPTFLLLVE
jgi:hypothetical protein